MNHVDGRRRLQPRDYLVDPHRFGIDLSVRPVIPEGGDVISARIALQEHRLACRWRERTHRVSGAELGRRFGFSRQVFSRAIRGERWLGESIVCALLATVDGKPVRS